MPPPAPSSSSFNSMIKSSLEGDPYGDGSLMGKISIPN